MLASSIVKKKGVGDTYLSASSVCWASGLFQEIDVRVVCETLHQDILHGRVPRELAGTLEFVPFQEEYRLVGVVGVLEEVAPAGAILPAGLAVFIEDGFPLRKVLDFAPYQEVCHGREMEEETQWHSINRFFLEGRLHTIDLVHWCSFAGRSASLL